MMKVGGAERERALHTLMYTHVYLKENKDCHGKAWHGNANKSPLATKVFLLTLRCSMKDGGRQGRSKNTTPIILFFLPFLSEYLRMCKQQCGVCLCAIIIRYGVILSSRSLSPHKASQSSCEICIMHEFCVWIVKRKIGHGTNNRKQANFMYMCIICRDNGLLHKPFSAFLETVGILLFRSMKASYVKCPRNMVTHTHTK